MTEKKPAARKTRSGATRTASTPGRKPKFDQSKLVSKICDRLKTGKEPLTVICRSLGIAVRTVNQWREDDEKIASAFDEARDSGYDAIGSECLEIADTPQIGLIEKLEPITDDDGNTKYVVTERRNEDMLAHRKLRIETRLKLLAKWDPRRYGDKHIIAGDKDNPLLPPPAKLTDAQLLAIAAQGVREKDGSESDG